MLQWLCGVVLLLAAPGTAAPAPEPAVVAQPTYRVGDTWTFDRTHEVTPNGFKQERVVITVSRVDSDDVLLALALMGSPGAPHEQLLNPDLSSRILVDGAPGVGERYVAFPLKLGATWTEDYVDPQAQGVQSSAHITSTSKVVGWEDVTTPAGVFHALKIESHGKIMAQVALPAFAGSAASATPYGGTAISHSQRAISGTLTVTTFRQVYYAPEVKTYVKTVFEHYDAQGVMNHRDTNMLNAYKVAP